MGRAIKRCRVPREELLITTKLWISEAGYEAATDLDFSNFVSGIGHRKGIHQKQYQEMQGYLNRLKNYAFHIEIRGERRNSHSKTDHDATFMRVKCDYMGNDQLLAAYNMQAAICDEYIAVIDAKPYASDMECFIPLMEKFKETYGHYPKYHNKHVYHNKYGQYMNVKTVLNVHTGPNTVKVHPATGPQG